MHAVDDCEVDIISISFGFEEHDLDGELWEAIEHAIKNGVHIFAAAANGGANKGRSYPATHPGVFCIYPTDALGNRLDFSPTPLTQGFNFATVGEAVCSTWPIELPQPEANQGGGGPSTAVRSGTSFATPIAACLAAFVLRFAKIHLEPKYLRNLKTHAVMEKVLGSIAEKRDDIHYLMLLPGVKFLFGREKKHEKIREDMKEIIEPS